MLKLKIIHQAIDELFNYFQSWIYRFGDYNCENFNFMTVLSVRTIQGVKRSTRKCETFGKIRNLKLKFITKKLFHISESIFS